MGVLNTNTSLLSVQTQNSQLPNRNSCTIRVPINYHEYVIYVSKINTLYQKLHRY